MYSIISANSESHHLGKLREWIDAEWGGVDPFEGNVKGFIVPSPILVVNDQKLMGGLTFTSFAMPDSEELGVWVNTLLVVPEYRNMGIGSQLVQAAEVEAKRIKIKELFVYTHIPKLYQKLDWFTVSNNGESTVLKRVIVK